MLTTHERLLLPDYHLDWFVQTGPPTGEDVIYRPARSGYEACRWLPVLDELQYSVTCSSLLPHCRTTTHGSLLKREAHYGRYLQLDRLDPLFCAAADYPAPD